ncbi:hypothetical protein Q3G72_012964 [Acer saccharum]|nr:hypothetical protein Q3G72_012964 [Acer saccharum]
MVESFIKKYQSSNNGNFPSLNLTHKEVGGSFYTVREIVREIIQENRVLGPAKFSPEELNYLQDEQGPLGSIAIEPSTPLYITSNESHFVPNHHQATSEESVSISDVLCSENEIQRFENEQIIGGYQYQVDVRIEESDKQKSEDLKTSEQLEAEKNSAASTAIVIPIAEDIVVETFPLGPVPNIVDGLNTSSAVKNLNETENVKLEQGNGSAPLGQITSSANSNLVIEKKAEILTAVVFDKNSDLVDEEVEENFADPQLKSSNNFTTEGGTVSDTHVDTDVEIEVLHNNVLISEINEQSQRVDGSKAINALNGKSSNGNYASQEQVRTPKAIVSENEANVQGEVNSHKGSNPTLDRINLASWEGASRKSAETTTSPILVIFKSFVTAFMKFWSE